MSCGGCGQNGDQPKLGKVRGVVTLDGQPVSGAGVVFSQAGHRSATGRTNSDGEYEMMYMKDAPGAIVGNNVVRILRPGQEGTNSSPQIPAKYNRDSELRANVTPGRNQIDFALESAN